MKIQTRRALRQRGFTLVELLVSCGVMGVISVGLTMGIVALSRSLSGTVDYSTNHADQMRISDYLAMDLRRAVAVTIVGTGQSTRLSIAIPNYYETSGSARMPVIDAKGSVNYQDGSVTPPASSVTVNYYFSGGSMIREQEAKKTVLAVNVQDFQLAVLDSATDPNATKNFNIPVTLTGSVAEVKTRISFNSRFTSNPNSPAVTTFYNTTLLRNTRKDYTNVSLY
jgi:prepilin-type N-terminal cleavage/methylation domain-containing protein